MTAVELEKTVPTWHAVFTLQCEPHSSQECVYARQVVDYVAHQVYLDGSLRMCVSVVNLEATRRARAATQAAQRPVPIGTWIPSRHESHEKHDKREVGAGTVRREGKGRQLHWPVLCISPIAYPLTGLRWRVEREGPPLAPLRQVHARAPGRPRARG